MGNCIPPSTQPRGSEAWCSQRCFAPCSAVWQPVLRRLGERHCPHQVVSEGVPQRHRFDLVKPAHQKLTEPASARNSVHTFGGGGPLLVNLLGCLTAHALAPLSKRFAVIGQ